MQNKQGAIRQDKRVATLTLDDGRSIELPILSGTLGQDVIDIHGMSKLGRIYLRSGFFLNGELHVRDHLY